MSMWYFASPDSTRGSQWLNFSGELYVDWYESWRKGQGRSWTLHTRSMQMDVFATSGVLVLVPKDFKMSVVIWKSIWVKFIVSKDMME